MAIYIYCVVKAARRPAMARVPKGLPGASAPEPFEVGGGLWLVSARVPLAVYGPEALQLALRETAWVSDVALAHDAVIEHFARQRTMTTIPLKVFTMFSTPERAVSEMRARRRELQGIARAITGAEEWGVRVNRLPPSTTRAASPAPSSGAAFLAAKKAVRDDAREAAMAAAQSSEDAFAVLGALARASARRDDVPPGAAAPPLLDAAFLVALDHRAKFRAAAKRLAGAVAASGATLTLTGPWPAYSFVHVLEPRS